MVLPAPLGPMSAVIDPRWISTWATSTAESPPKRRTIELATKMGSGLGAPGTRGTVASADCASRARWPLAGIKGQLSFIAENALRSENHQTHEAKANEDESDRANVGRQ
ncbi:unannotated protein [freshwater metagenome]|uniref:Unannotated protein n=1 Tax=freshwater metagenome TaxID=449393 RepID=A0A6J7QA46_9ZZZZ